MVINENNSQINSFGKGMNSDISYDQIENQQYVFGQNIRITKNQLLGGSGDYSSLHEGIVTPVVRGVSVVDNLVEHPDFSGKKILSVRTVDRLGVIVCNTIGGKNIEIYRFKIDETTNQLEELRSIWSYDIWNSASDVPDQVSTVLYKELDNVIKLYIATGSHPLMCIRVDDEGVGKIEGKILDDFISNRILPTKRIFIEGITSGRLTASQVQYTYRYYNKYGNTTQLAPLTNKIQVIDPSRSKDIGNAEDTETSIGFILSIDINDYIGHYERLQIYRLSYIKPGEDAEVALIYDGDIKRPHDGKDFVINDVGIDPIQELTIEEFSAMSGIILIPQTIEQNQEYMFCANIKDDTIIRDAKIPESYYNDQNRLSITKANVILSEKIEGDIPDPGDTKYVESQEYNQLEHIQKGQKENITETVQDYLQQRGINPNDVTASYTNIITSSLLRSLRRGEIYKYAIIFYDKYGRRTEVMNLGEIDTPEYEESRPFTCTDKLVAHPIGVNIKIPQITNASDIIGCQIVRRSSSDIYQKTLLQVALARPVQQGLLDLNLTGDQWASTTEETVKKSPYYPTGFMQVNDMMIKPSYYYDAYLHPDRKTDSANNLIYWISPSAQQALHTKTNNLQLYQIFSSEIDFRRDDVLSRLNVSDAIIQEKLYIASNFAKYSNNTKEEFYNTTFFQGAIASTEYNFSVNNMQSYACMENIQNTCIVQNPINTSARAVYIRTNPDVNATYGEFVIFDSNNYIGTAGPQFTIGDNILNDPQIVEFLNNSSGDNIGISIASPSEIDHVYVYTYENQDVTVNTDNGNITIDRAQLDKMTITQKQATHYIFDYFKTGQNTRSNFTQYGVNAVKDVKMANWNDGFTSINREPESQNVFDAIKKYRSYTTNIDSFVYNNWVSFGKYDFRPGVASAPNMNLGDNGTQEVQEFLGKSDSYVWWLDHNYYDMNLRKGPIGPGPSCLLLTTKDETGGFPMYENKFYTSICNIQHTPKTVDIKSEEFEQYFGFGNYFNLKYVKDEETDQWFLRTEDDKDYLTVFDGDIYITPHEFTTVYKTYNFESVDTLQSTQITNYVPLESKVNTFFDYGMNLMNTQSENLLYEPGSIDGVTTQERPVHQYNMVYSDNDASNDIFTLISTDENETNNFKQRAYYSELKSNGEFIDNFMIFKAAAFIDVDSKYGQITNMLTDKNMLYYWQDHAFGKFSVNERSLVNDQNNNTIMLGQAGILSRYDYLSTKYGMRLYDFCAISVENGIYWVDINNKAVVGTNGNQVANYGEQVGVQNIINDRITNDVPKVDYDLQNNELLCKCFGNDQIVFNLKYNIATSIYTRRYDDIAYIKNHMYGLFISGDSLQITKHNYLQYENMDYLTPLQLEFIVNPMASVTKVYDSQQLVPIKRDRFDASRHILDYTTFAFETDLINKQYGESMEPYTDREGNIIYNVPRYQNMPYGNRIRGKWMKVNINNNNPSEYFTISHMITKFRQSFS